MVPSSTMNEYYYQEQGDGTDEDGSADVLLDGSFAFLDFGNGRIQDLLVEMDEQVGDLFRELVVGPDKLLGLALVFFDFVPILSLGLVGKQS